MTTLRSDEVRDVLARLYEAEMGDEKLLAAIGTRISAQLTAEQRAELLAEAYLPVARENGELLYLLARGRAATRVVEFGTSFGISTIFLAAAVRDNGGGEVITTEIHPDKARTASANLAEAGLADLVRIRTGDALRTLTELPGPVDLVLLDGWKDLYLPVLRILEPSLRSGALIVADDRSMLPAAYLDYMRDPQNGYHSVEIPIDDGLEVSIRT
jgi:predicted O-methyltransferase YrrM